MSDWLDGHWDVLDWVLADVQRAQLKLTGRSGMSIESILRCGILKQHRQWTYEELAFHVSDSATAAAFVRLPNGLSPTDSALQGVIGLIRGATWERISQARVQVQIVAQQPSADSLKRAEYYTGLAVRVIDQAVRRVIKGEKVAASERVVSIWIDKKLKRFRAGIEGTISMLKRVFGLDRCTWRGLEHFKAYVMSAVLAYNFKVFVRLSRQTL